MNKCPVIVAIMAHADDIEYDAGGTFAKYISQGYHGVYGVLSLCNSGNCPEDGNGPAMKPSNEVVPRRMAEARAAATVFGAELFQMDLMESVYTDSNGFVVPLEYPRDGLDLEDPPQGGLPFSSAAWGYYRKSDGKSAIDKVADVLIKYAPKLVISNCITQNPDHYSAALIVRQAYLKASQKTNLGHFYIGTHNNTGDIDFFPGEPEVIIDVTGFEETAIKAFSCHRTQGCHRSGIIEKRYERWRKWGEKINTRSAEPFRRIL